MYNVAMAVSAIIDWKFLTLLAERLLSLKPEILNPAIWNFPTHVNIFRTNCNDRKILQALQTNVKGKKSEYQNIHSIVKNLQTYSLIQHLLHRSQAYGFGGGFLKRSDHFLVDDDEIVIFYRSYVVQGQSLFK